MPYHAIPCNTMQYHAILCNTMQYHAIPCNTMQYQAIPCNTMRYNAIPGNTMQYHASLITADGAYHCPVGSIMAIFNWSIPVSWREEKVFFFKLHIRTPEMKVGQCCTELVPKEGGSSSRLVWSLGDPLQSSGWGLNIANRDLVPQNFWTLYNSTLMKILSPSQVSSFVSLTNTLHATHMLQIRRHSTPPTVNDLTMGCKKSGNELNPDCGPDFGQNTMEPDLA